MNGSKLSKINLIDSLLTFLSVIMLFVLMLTGYWLIRDYDIVDWKIDKYEMQKEEYKVGEPLTFRTAFCKKGNYEATLIYHIEDGVTYLIPSQVSRSHEGCRDFISSTIETPNLPTGEYILRGIITYHPNPLKEVTYTMESNKFKIINE